MSGEIRRLKLTGRSEVKGRNGYFRAAFVEGNVQGVPPHARVEISSSRAGDTPPSVLDLDPADAATLAHLLAELAREAGHRP